MPTPGVEPRFYTLEDVATILNVRIAQVYALVRSGDQAERVMPGREDHGHGRTEAHQVLRATASVPEHEEVRIARDQRAAEPARPALDLHVRADSARQRLPQEGLRCLGPQRRNRLLLRLTTKAGLEFGLQLLEEPANSW